MLRLIYKIKFGKHGILIQYDTMEVYYPQEWFDECTFIYRVGCHVTCCGKFGDTVFAFKSYMDAEDLAVWIAGAQGKENT